MRFSNEINQSIIRLGVVTVIFLYSTVHDSISRQVFLTDNTFLLLSFLLLAVLEWLWAIRFSKRNESDRQRIYFRVITNLIDNVLLAIAIIYMGVAGAPLFIVYLWITFGLGIRYGGKYLIFSAILNIVSFCVVLTISPLWTDGDTMYITLGILLSLIILPAYVYVLILKLANALESEKSANQIKQSFLANINHELRTPLNSILNLTELVRSHELPNKVYRMINMIRVSTETQLQIVNSMLDISKIETGQYNLIRNKFDLYKLIQEVQQIILPLSNSKGIKFTLFIDASCNRNYVGSGDQIKQILINILGNAVKYTNDGYVRIAVTSRTVSDAIHNIIFSMQDTGIGIENKNHQKVFMPFYRADNSITRQYGGAGLGITISDELAKLMGGELSLESNLELGTTFTLSVPLELSAQDEQQLSDKVKIYPLNVGLKYKNILENISNFGMLANEYDLMNAEKLVSKQKHETTIFIIDYSLPAHINDITHAILQQSDLLVIAAGNLPDYARNSATPITAISPETSRDELLNAINICTQFMPFSKQINTNNLPKIRRPINIMVAEDDLTLREIYKNIFTSTGHNITITNDGQEALDYLIKYKYDIAILDMHMPMLSGIDVARKAKLANKDITIKYVLLTADTENILLMNNQEELFDLILIKPIGPIALLHELYDMLGDSFTSTTAQDITSTSNGIYKPDMSLSDNANIEYRESIKDNINILDENTFKDILKIFDAEIKEQLIGLTKSILFYDCSESYNILHKMLGAASSVNSKILVARISFLLDKNNNKYLLGADGCISVGLLAQLHDEFMKESMCRD